MKVLVIDEPSPIAHNDSHRCFDAMVLGLFSSSYSALCILKPGKWDGKQKQSLGLKCTDRQPFLRIASVSEAS